jgi:hypothetical protein
MVVPRPLLRFVAGAALLAACTQYELRADPPRVDAPPEDEHPPCGVGLPAAAVDIDERCVEPAGRARDARPVVEWAKSTWEVAPDSVNIMMAPVVGSLTDDDGDDDADADDEPDIVVVTYGDYDEWPSFGTLRAVRGRDGAELWSVTDALLQPQGGVALGDLDGDGWTDIVALGADAVLRFDGAGRLVWVSEYAGDTMGRADAPSIADLDGDGLAEIVVGAAVFDADGVLVGRGMYGQAVADYTHAASFAVDVDGDGQAEVVTGNALYRRDGSTIWHNEQEDGYPAVADLDGDGLAEIVVTGNARMRIQGPDGVVRCSAGLQGAGGGTGGGPPSVGDLDGDGLLEVGVASATTYDVFDRYCRLVWTANTTDGSSACTSSLLVDLHADGAPEVVYADHESIHVFAGADGAVLATGSEHSNRTWIEYPTFADVDLDGSGEIVVANSVVNGRGAPGLTVYGDADGAWGPARPIWNQHAFHGTNVEDDGSIPPAAPFGGGFRAAAFTALGTPRPNLQPSLDALCLDACDDGRVTAWVGVRNVGRADAEGTRVLLQSAEREGTPITLAAWDAGPIPAGERLASVPVVVDAPEGTARLFVVVDPSAEVAECVEDDNEEHSVDSVCAD